MRRHHHVLVVDVHLNLVLVERAQGAACVSLPELVGHRRDTFLTTEHISITIEDELTVRFLHSGRHPICNRSVLDGLHG